MFKKKRGSPGSKGSPNLIKRQSKDETIHTSRSAHGAMHKSMNNIKLKTLRLGDIVGAKEGKKQK